MANVKNVAPGVGLCAAIAPSLLVSRRGAARGGRPGVRHPHRHGDRPVLEGSESAKSGITYTSKKVLQLAVVLLGFGMNLSVVVETGKQSLPIIICTISTSLVVAWILHKVMHIESNISTLISLFMQHMLNLW